MVINFGKYRFVSEGNDGYDYNTLGKNGFGYIDVSNSPFAQSLNYDEKKFNDLIKNRQYEEAANYASKYHFNDPEIQAQHENDIETLRLKGRQVSAFYDKIDKRDLDAVDFNMSVFEDGGLESLNSDNLFSNKYIEAKNKLGGENSTALKIKFNPQERTIFGFIPITDNPNSLESFYKNSGWNEQYLSSQGIKVTKEKGKDVLIFDKANPLANQIINNLPYRIQSDNVLNYMFGGESNIEVEGLDDKGNVIQQNINDTYNAIHTMQQLVDQTKNVVINYQNDGQTLVKNYSSTIGGLLAPELEELKQQRDRGELTPSQYNTAYKTKYNNILTTLQNIGSSAYEIYGNNGKDINDETLRLLNNKERAEAIRMISSDYDVTLKAMVSNGEIGTLVEIGALPEQVKNIGDNPIYDEMTKSRRFQFFIPGLFTDLAQQQINRNTLTRSSQELNSMQDYAYTYKTFNNEDITPNGLGSFIYTKNNQSIEIAKEDAQRIINKDMAIKDGQKLKYQFINDSDYLANFDTYDALVKQYAFNVVNELYPRTPIEDMQGNQISIEEAFNMMSLNGSTVMYDKAWNLNTSVKRKLDELYNIYNSILKSADYYINTNRITY